MTGIAVSYNTGTSPHTSWSSFPMLSGMSVDPPLSSARGWLAAESRNSVYRAKDEAVLRSACVEVQASLKYDLN